MKENRCYLCGGRLAGGICSECGLDNRKKDSSYRLNTSSCDDLPLTHVHEVDNTVHKPGKYGIVPGEPGATAKKNRANDQGAKKTVQGRMADLNKAGQGTQGAYNVGKQTGQGPAGPYSGQQKSSQRTQHAYNSKVRNSEGTAGAYASQQRSSQGTADAYASRQPSSQSTAGAYRSQQYGQDGRPRKKKVKIWNILVTVIILLAVLGKPILNFLEKQQGVSSIGEMIDNVKYDLGGGETEYDPYLGVEAELPETGNSYEGGLAAGYYIAGIDLPAGGYGVTLTKGSAQMLVHDDENGIYLYEFFGDGKEEIQKMKDVRLFPGAKLRVQGDGELEFTSRNAQTDELVESEPNDLQEEVLITGTMTAGVEFPGGTYDMYGYDGYGYLEFTIPGDQEVYRTHSILITPENEPSSGYSYHVRNVYLPQDTVITAENFTVRLVPSDKKVNEDPIEFYNGF